MDKNNNRIPLASVLPLEVPISIQIAASMVCNLRCEFCSQSEQEYRIKGENAVLSFELLKQFVDSVAEHNGKLKNIEFNGLGEPLLCEELPEMISYIKEKDICDHVVVVTNGTLLSKEWSHRLTDCGLDLLRVSVNGLSGEDYLKHTGKNVDFEKYVENIRYFYSLADQGNTRVYIKIMDYMVEREQDRNRFYGIFEGCAHTLNIEGLIKTSPYVDYERKFGEREYDRNQKEGTHIVDANICPRSFFDCMLCADGNVMSCCYGLWNPQSDLIMGNLKDDSFYDIWNGDVFKTFRRNMLDGIEHAPSTCQSCPVWKNQICEEDVLDSDVDYLKTVY